MATTSDLRRGMLIRYNGDVWRVLEYQHIAPGNWRAMVRMKLKNINNGKVIEDRVRAGSDIDVVQSEVRPVQFLYKDGNTYHFMDAETFDQIALDEELVGDAAQFMRENDTVNLLVLDGSHIAGVELPTFVTLKVVQADVAVRGDTATNVLKNVTLETGAVIQAPSFVKEGDYLKIDTRTGEYIERVKE
ncbi:MAG: elongation factor P [Thermoflexales bacterium]|nr:elongation factor P [Thermoflexales bacterium]MDW8352218.1 elongation factor P [Anaerolineae bacterium]